MTSMFDNAVKYSGKFLLLPVAASMGCPGNPWISLRFQLFRIRRHISPNPATYFDILLNNSRLESRCTTSWISQGFKGDAATDFNPTLSILHPSNPTPFQSYTLFNTLNTLTLLHSNSLTL